MAPPKRSRKRKMEDTETEEVVVQSKAQAVERPIEPLAPLELFDKQKMQVSIINTHYKTQLPAQTYDASTPISFDLPAFSSLYADPLSFYLSFYAWITELDGTELAAEANCAVATNFSQTIWQDVEVKLNSCVISQRSGLHGFKAYFNRAFLTSESYISSHEQAAMIYLPKTNCFDKVEPKDNEPYDTRKKLFQLSKHRQIYAKVESEIFNQEKFIAPGTKIQIVFHPAADRFRLLSGDAAPAREKKLHIDNVILHYRMVELNPLLHIDLLASWRQYPYSYPIKRLQMQLVQKQAGTSAVQEVLVSGGILPDQVYVACCPSTAVLGSYSEEPFGIDSTNLAEMSIFAEGRTYPNPALNLDVTSQEIVRSYCKFLDAAGWENREGKPHPDLEAFLGGYAIGAIDLQRLRSDIESVPRTGTAVLNIRYSQATTIGITYIIMLVYSNEVYIPFSGDVSSNFTYN